MNMYEANNKIPKNMKQKMIEFQRDTDKSMITFGNFNTLFPIKIE